MEENKFTKQEKFFYDKILSLEKEYIQNNYSIGSNKLNDNNNKLVEIENLIIDIIAFEKNQTNIFYKQTKGAAESKKHDNYQLSQTLIKKAEKLAIESGGFIYMPYRIIIYNFFIKYKNTDSIVNSYYQEKIDTENAKLVNNCGVYFL